MAQTWIWRMEVARTGRRWDMTENVLMFSESCCWACAQRHCDFTQTFSRVPFDKSWEVSGSPRKDGDHKSWLAHMVLCFRSPGCLWGAGICCNVWWLLWRGGCAQWTRSARETAATEQLWPAVRPVGTSACPRHPVPLSVPRCISASLFAKKSSLFLKKQTEITTRETPGALSEVRGTCSLGGLRMLQENLRADECSWKT